MSNDKKPETDAEKCALALSVVRAYIRHKAPYVAKTLYGLVPYEVPGLGTLAVTEHLVLMIDPSWFIKLKLEMQGAVIMHEIGHVIRGIKRLAAMPNPELANIAFDIPINSDLRDAGWSLPDWACFPESYDVPKGLTGEQYYELLDKQLKNKNKKLCAAIDGGLQVAAGKCGGCGGNEMPSQEKEIDSKVGRTTNEVEHVRRATANDIRAYVGEKGKGRGNVPKTLIEWLPEDEERLVWISWRSELSNILRRTTGRVQNGRSDYSYRRPSRRSFMYGMLKPGMIARLPTIGFAEDTSGSMGKEQLQEGRIQAIDVLLQLGIQDAWWISADARVSTPPRILRMNEIRRLPVIGRGGTDFRPAIDLAQTLRPRPDILIYLTDGDGTAPEFKPYGMEVIFCIVPGPYSREVRADWATNIVLEDRLVAA
jgi:predicted metal-dependent peptidase